MEEKKKLSTFIREGAKLRPQAFGNPFRLVDNPDAPVIGDEEYDPNADYSIIGSCAFGAAAEYRGEEADIYINNAWIIDWVLKEFFDGNAPDITHPVTKQKNFWLVSAVIGLNDNCKWTREQIADWLESIGY